MKFLCLFLVSILCLSHVMEAQSIAIDTGSHRSARVKTAYGILEGIMLSGGVASFRGIPYAKPPVGDLRWKAPQPPASWEGVRDARNFGARPMQKPVFSDMVFRSGTISEDCLYLNIWTQAKASTDSLPVLVYFYGGGFMAGDGSEPRYDGAALARKGIVTVTVNYRLGVFGFLALPALADESPHHAAGNYGLLDQQAALRWVRNNITAFGGNPRRVTIAGQSAGSRSVSAQMAAPLSKGLFAAAIGESGSILGNPGPPTLKESEQNGLRFMHLAGAPNLAALRRMPATALLKLAAQPGAPRFGPDIDGYFLPRSPVRIFSTGLQSDVPLLAGWNSAEVDYHSLLGKDTPTLAHYRAALQKLYGDQAAEALRLYPAATVSEVKESATALAGDRYIGYAVWKWIDLHGKTDGKNVYRYRYAHLLPPTKGSKPARPEVFGAPHSSEIPYALGNLPLIKAYDWSDDDYRVSAILEGYFVNFIKTGNPNGPGLPDWHVWQSSIPKVMVIDTKTKAVPEQNKKRYLFLDRFYHHPSIKRK